MEVLPRTLYVVSLPDTISARELANFYVSVGTIEVILFDEDGDSNPDREAFVIFQEDNSVTDAIDTHGSEATVKSGVDPVSVREIQDTELEVMRRLANLRRQHTARLKASFPAAPRICSMICLIKFLYFPGQSLLQCFPDVTTWGNLLQQLIRRDRR